MSESNVKRGTEYEKFVQQVYQILNAQSDLSDVKVQQNIFLEGNSRTHQIDVYWEFCKAGIEYKVAVECKDYKKHIPAKEIDSFATVLNDLGNIKGVFVSKRGFQLGAIQDAERYGIQLMEIREPRTNDLNGITKKLTINLKTENITELRHIVEVDPTWLQGAKIEATKKIDYTTTQAKVEIGNKVFTIQELIKQLPVDTEGEGIKHVFSFPNGWYIDDEGNKLRINNILFIYTVEHHKDVFVHDLSSAIKAVVNNVITGETTLVRM